MQFHLNGFEPGDPEISDRSQRHPASGASGAVPDKVDVLIIGCGPAGLTLAAQLSAFPDLKTCIVEQKEGPLLRGQADGVACRTMERNSSSASRSCSLSLRRCEAYRPSYSAATFARSSSSAVSA